MNCFGRLGARPRQILSNGKMKEHNFMVMEKPVALEDSPACSAAQSRYVTDGSIPLAAQISINDLLEQHLRLRSDIPDVLD